ncbi:MAG: GAF domain-containing protein [Bacteroidetes bacterium]|jgi:GAF domain-containing protein|nr:GAF domain-containing protein [Bacteroidota bacterium]MBK6838354.1 GAF domain-containing protein [Bacteroidota bacterium]MBK9526289.1 GAF domain-containing protein [Bacteroidota bacterium]MBK9544127.1 GAF domain-containing protein [Bacteroidota bacterium]MBP6402440.1 GAF domain-containing protein [Bacteroidia bacterium]
MSENINIPSGLDKKEVYRSLIPQLKALVEGEKDTIANLANIIAAIKETFGFLWVGYYFVKVAGDQNELVLGPFQGPVACTRIGFGKGVCGTAWKETKTIVVPDVDLFPGHIACSSLSRSEIVVPVFINGKVVGVLDIDSKELNQFNAEDAEALEEIARLISTIL